MISVVRKNSVTPVEDATRQRNQGQQIKRVGPPYLPHHKAVDLGAVNPASIWKQQLQIQTRFHRCIFLVLPDRHHIKPSPLEGRLPEDHPPATEPASVIVQYQPVLLIHSARFASCAVSAVRSDRLQLEGRNYFRFFSRASNRFSIWLSL